MIYIAATSLLSKPWKNGGGTTVELVISPPGADASGRFDWRISTATVASSGPFSIFDGCDRTIVQLAGSSIRLVHEIKDEGIEMAREVEQRLIPGVPHQFAGEWQTSAYLDDGTALDFNVIVRREVVHSITYSVGADTGLWSAEAAAAITLIHASGGPCIVDCGSVSRRIETGDSLFLGDEAALLKGSASQRLRLRPAFQLRVVQGLAIVVDIIAGAKCAPHPPPSKA